MDIVSAGPRDSETSRNVAAKSSLSFAGQSADASNCLVQRPFADRIVRVLLVDDHMLVRAGLRTLLDQEPDIEIVGEATTGEQAIVMAEQCKPHVILMDLDMPGAGGIEATRILTAPDVHPWVLVLTMHSEGDRLVAALRAGASGYITKDVAQQELLCALRTAATGGVTYGPMSDQCSRRVCAPGRNHP